MSFHRKNCHRLGSMYVYNPLKTDFVTTYDVDGNGVPHEFRVPSLSVVEFTDEVVGKHVVKHLATMIMHTRGVEMNPEDDLRRIREEIIV